MDTHRVLRYVIAHLAFFLVVSLYSIQGRLDDQSLKSIKTKYGDEYDCLELYKQPALSHSLLKDHKIQMRPSFDPQRDNANPIGNGITGTSLDLVLIDSCPYGTVPIRRRSKAELMRAKPMLRQHFRSLHSSTNNTPTGFIFAGLGTEKNEATVYHGAGGTISINNPIVYSGQFSASVISIEGGPADQFSVIRVGWMVNFDLFRDNNTHLYSIWGQGKDGQMHGCYYTVCPGFVQTDPSIALDMILGLGDQGNWWLIYGDDDKPVGYWPSSLFTNLNKGASALRWGGMVYSSSDQVPTMGNGDNGKIHSAHFRQVTLKYESGSSLNGTIDVPIDVMQTRCYKSGDNYYKGEFWDYSFYFGGNGGDVSQCS